MICEIRIDCAKSYYFEITTFLEINVNLYNSSQNLVNININRENNNNMATYFSQYLNKGVYYLRMNFVNINASSNVIINCKPTWQSYGTEVLLGENQINTHMHVCSNNYSDNLLYFINTLGAGFYKFTLQATRKDGGIVTFPQEAILIKDHMDESQVYKYDVMGYSELAATNYDFNSMYVYLDRNGYFYIHIKMPISDYSNMNLIIERIGVETIDVSERIDEAFIDTLFSNSECCDYAKGIEINQKSTFKLNIITSVNPNNNITFVLFKKNYNSSTATYYKTDIVANYLPYTPTELILDEGTYYIGYFGNINSITITCKLERILNLSDITTQVLVLDPNAGYTYGTEVRHNNGEFGGKTITEGFTRHIHFNNVTGVPSVKRQDYNFYSSNTSYAIVSEFGTVFAKAVSQNREVTITAVYKYDPAIIFTIDLVIVNDTSNTSKVIETTQTIYLSNFVDGKYKLVLDEYNSPYPWIQYFNWSVYVPCQKNDILVTIDSYGFLTTTGAGSATLTGTYTMNPNVTVIIHINFLE